MGIENLDCLTKVINVWPDDAHARFDVTCKLIVSMIRKTISSLRNKTFLKKTINHSNFM